MEISKINKFTCNPKDIHRAARLASAMECHLQEMAEHFINLNSEGRSFELCFPENTIHHPPGTPLMWLIFKSVGYDPQVPSKAVVPFFMYIKGPVGSWNLVDLTMSIGNKHINSSTDVVDKEHKVTFNNFFTWVCGDEELVLEIGGKQFCGLNYPTQEAKKHVARLCLRAVFLKFFKLHSIAFFWWGITVEKEGLAVFEEDGKATLLGEGAKRLRKEYNTSDWFGKKQKSA